MKVSTFLMFAGEARAALDLYTSTFPQFEVGAVSEHQIADGSTGIQTAELSMPGFSLVLSDSSVESDFTFTPSTSLFVDLDSEEELDAAFKKLSDGGSVLMPPDNYGFSRKYAWVTDRFGVSWQLNLP